MKRFGLVLMALAALAGCGDSEEEAGGLTADERQRLENIAERLDEERSAVREALQGDGNEFEGAEAAGEKPKQ